MTERVIYFKKKNKGGGRAEYKDEECPCVRKRQRENPWLGG